MTDLLRTPAAWPRILLEHAGAADPVDLDAAVAAGAFEALRRVVHELGPTATIAVVAASALRGRGGGGFPTGEKWRSAASQPAERRYVVANGYESDPATRTDRTLMERDPYAVVEGTSIAAWAVGATEAIIAVRADGTAAIRALEGAIGEAQSAGYLGPDVLGTGRDLAVTVRPVQGAYLLGEETVLLKALEGKRGQPEQRPPYPSERGLFGAPTVVNNVATLAAVPWIVRHGPEAFASIGSTAAPGTVLAHVRGPQGEGIAEVPTGTPLRELVGLAGGVGRDHTLKAVVVGGPSAGILPPELLDTPYEFGALREAGAHVGSGSVLIADDRACIVDLGRLLTTFCASEACGKTIPCRIGTRRLQEIAERTVDGRPRPTDLALLDDLSHDIAASALCDHERLTTLPLLSAMRYFRSELDDHLLRSSCPAGVCRPIAMTLAGTAH
jgi:NADH:ubiquinone oxidoreductase subunit F (NADH-binding)